ncbi:uncharacterized protein DFL_005161 [Arthrobotrys flagrans]|uniref:Uncharacterized protein n=1 Tax=Arthrobotrys flagrans TaxID=97331 RepID=A0A437A7H2_ARTFL|nr:hypothetical protein DFL_005161 [Arthrobotrys flagrans]
MRLGLSSPNLTLGSMSEALTCQMVWRPMSPLDNKAIAQKSTNGHLITKAFGFKTGKQEVPSLPRSPFVASYTQLSIAASILT